MEKQKTGTREWSEHSANCITGCAHGCLYCYAREMALRFGRIPDGQSWSEERYYWPKIGRKQGVVMFPTTHDITESTLTHCLKILKRLLDAGNRVLVVTKSGLEVVKDITKLLADYPVEQSELRFSLTHWLSSTGAFWEPSAPPLASRLAALRHTVLMHIRTSVSCEPWLDDLPSLLRLVDVVYSDVSETIWIGHANKLRQRLAWCMSDDIAEQIRVIEARQTPDAALEVYNALSSKEKIRWKDSYKKAISAEVMQ